MSLASAIAANGDSMITTAVVVPSSQRLTIDVHLLWLLLSGCADARVDDRRDEVCEKLTCHDRQGRRQRHAHDDGYVDLLDRLPGKLADARPAIDRLHHHH